MHMKYLFNFVTERFGDFWWYWKSFNACDINYSVI